MENYKEERWDAYVVPNTVNMSEENKQKAIFCDTGICLGVIMEVNPESILFLSSENKVQLMGAYISGEL